MRGLPDEFAVEFARHTAVAVALVAVVVFPSVISTAAANNSSERLPPLPPLSEPSTPDQSIDAILSQTSLKSRILS